VTDPIVEVSGREAWPLTSAGDAADELIRLVETLGVPGWSYTPASAGRPALDLRTTQGLDPLPLVLPDGEAIGTVRCPSQPTGDAGDAALRVLLQTVVLLVAMERRGWAAVDRAALFERESRLDSLTGLPNRRFWEEALAQEQARCNRHGLRALVAVVDLDDLKDTNDHQGHLAGDVLLRLTGQALRRAVRDTDLVARLGGDEFAILAVEFEDGDPDQFVDRVHRSLAESSVAASVGVAVAAPGVALAMAFDRADQTMYAVKRTRKAPDERQRSS